MHRISFKLLFVLILLFHLLSLVLLIRLLAPGLPDHKDLTGERYPGAGTPPNSTRSLDYKFGIIPLPIEARAKASGQSIICATRKSLIMFLADGVLKDSMDRTGCIAANRQFRFYYPPFQHDLLFSGGFSVRENGILALGQDDVFYGCPSEEERVWKPYDMRIADDCYPVLLEIAKITQC